MRSALEPLQPARAYARTPAHRAHIQAHTRTPARTYARTHAHPRTHTSAQIYISSTKTTKRTYYGRPQCRSGEALSVLYDRSDASVWRGQTPAAGKPFSEKFLIHKMQAGLSPIYAVLNALFFVHDVAKGKPNPTTK